MRCKLAICGVYYTPAVFFTPHLYRSVTKSKAWMTYYESKIGVNRVDRDDITYDDKKLPEAIKNCNEDVAQIKAYFTLVKKINSDLKVDEAALDLGSISIGNSPKKPTRV
jgi:hypothetical protein